MDGKILLLKNERNEWDLPGGKMDSKESFEECLKREFKEETDLEISVSQLNTVKKISVANQIDVIIIMYNCTTTDSSDKIKVSFEHKEFGLFSTDSLDEISINPILKNCICNSFAS